MGRNLSLGKSDSNFVLGTFQVVSKWKKHKKNVHQQMEQLKQTYQTQLIEVCTSIPPCCVGERV